MGGGGGDVGLHVLGCRVDILGTNCKGEGGGGGHKLSYMVVLRAHGGFA